MSSDEPRRNNLPDPKYTLDLHGRSKSEAISRITDFLERSSLLMNPENAWVLIITGSGAHSMHGPVLRGAVEALLRKRKIKYYLMKGRGSFLVNAASGIVLHKPPQPRDSKVIIAANSVSIKEKVRYLERDRTENRDDSRAIKKEFHDQCKEKNDFDKAISISLEEKERTKKEDEKLLGRAVNLSLLEKEKQSREDKELALAKDMSKLESLINATPEDEQIQKTLALSKVEFDYRHNPDACIQEAIELSRKESQEIDNEMLRNFEASSSDYNQNQEDEGFLRALELSMVDF
mmetsp:Transcript_15929/g.36884  ORF Transcript_15929/g.36884 Transcript_15929/m.36884 type:complete len:291 (-) Transcript_15929:59-931(-)